MNCSKTNSKLKGNFHDTSCIPIVSKAIQCNDYLLINRHLGMVGIIMEYLIIMYGFHQRIKAMWVDMQIGLENVRKPVLVLAQ